MDYKIIVDSCGELTYKMKESGVYVSAPLSMQVDGDTVVDDDTFDQKDFLRRVGGPARNVRSHPARLLRNIWSCTAGMKKGSMW